MGLFKTIGRAFVEEVPTDTYEVSVDMDALVEDTVEAELESVNTNTLIDDIYAQNDLLDKSCSIFKVEELITSLPKEMATSTKRSSVLAILGSFNLTVTEVSEDGENRIKVLNSIKEKIDADCKNAIINKEEKIEELKKSIETLTVEIANEQEKMKTSDETILSEMEKVDSLMKFIGGEN
jgi:hypothetical protein